MRSQPLTFWPCQLQRFAAGLRPDVGVCLNDIAATVGTCTLPFNVSDDEFFIY